MIETGLIYGHCNNCWRSRAPDQQAILEKYGEREWGPGVNIRLRCRACGSSSVSVFQNTGDLQGG